MGIRLGLSALAFTVAVAAAPAANAAVDAFIWFEGGPGGAHSESFRVSDVAVGSARGEAIATASRVPAGGAGAGMPQFHELTVTRQRDAASPSFFRNCVGGAHYSKVVIEMRKAGGDPSTAGKPYLRYTFSTVFTTKVSWAHGDDSPTESVTFEYGALQVQYEAQKPGVSPTTALQPVGPAIRRP